MHHLTEMHHFFLVPYVNPSVTGTITGVVGAGGNVGAVAFGLAFRQLDTMKAFYTMAGCICGSGLLTSFICIKQDDDILNTYRTGNFDLELDSTTKRIDSTVGTVPKDQSDALEDE